MKRCSQFIFLPVIALLCISGLDQQTLISKVFAAPPRQATDVIDLLNRDSAEDLKKLNALKKIAEGKPPADLSSMELARFYSDRARIADLLGRVEQSIADHGKASALPSILVQFVSRTRAARNLPIPEKPDSRSLSALDFVECPDVDELRGPPPERIRTSWRLVQFFKLL